VIFRVDFTGKDCHINGRPSVTPQIWSSSEGHLYWMKPHNSRTRLAYRKTSPGAAAPGLHAEFDGHSQGAHNPSSSSRAFPTRRSIGCKAICVLVTVASSISANCNTIWLQSLWRSLSAFEISSVEACSELMIVRSLRSSAQVTARSARRATILLLG